MTSTFTRKPPKPKKCKVCRTEPVHKFGAKVCGSECAKAYVEQLNAKAERAQAKQVRMVDKVRKEAIKSRSDWLREAQTAFNAYIRARDAHLPCISCGRDNDCKINAGHYLSVGSHPELRFSEDNCHKQCEHCNTYKSGNQAAYRPRLIERIGLERVEWLEGHHEPAKYTVEQIKAIKTTYKQKFKELAGK